MYSPKLHFAIVMDLEGTKRLQRGFTDRTTRNYKSKKLYLNYICFLTAVASRGYTFTWETEREMWCLPRECRRCVWLAWGWWCARCTWRTSREEVRRFSQTLTSTQRDKEQRESLYLYLLTNLFSQWWKTHSDPF